MDNSSKKTVIINLIIAIIIMIAVVGSATYAYFTTARNFDEGDLNVAAQTAERSYIFTASTDGSINYLVYSADMSQLNVHPTDPAATDDANLTLHLATPYTGQKASCTYDIVWTWKSGENLDIYTLPDISLPYTHTDGIIYNHEFSVEVDGFVEETDLSKFELDENYSFVLIPDQKLETTSPQGVDIVYHIATSMYNMPIPQKVVFDTQFSANITVENVECILEDTKEN